MKSASEKNYRYCGFSLIEAVTAVIILGIVCSGLLVVFNRSMSAVADSKMKMQAMEVARANMEGLLTLDSVQEKIEYGTSEKYPEIEWETKVEPFYEPITEQMWVRAVCIAEYTDRDGEKQQTQLNHWLTNLTKKQLLEMIEQKQESMKYEPEDLIYDIEEAAEYAGVDVVTLEEWQDNGMPLTEDGEYIKPQLDLYKRTDGNPSAQQKERVILEQSQQELAEQAEQQAPEQQQDSQDKQLEAPSEKDEPQDNQDEQSKPDEQVEDNRTEEDTTEPDSSQPETDDTNQQQRQSNNPMGLPDGYQNWSINEIIQFLKEKGYF
jgi:type II secretory pathway pseudopilin PulG